jgi:hypothetical protein
MDNPYCLTYYNIQAFQKYRKILKIFLERAHKLTFMSEASMHHFLQEWGGRYKNKSMVFYPYARRRYKRHKKIEKKEVLNFLFVGLDFRRKGGLELLEAFADVRLSNINLYIVSKVSEKIKRNFQTDKRIIFLEPLPREKLLTQLFPQMDIFVFPSLHESFGVVLLEALSFGMGLIATNTYAVPEMLHHGENGVLLHHPFLKPEVLYGKKRANQPLKRENLVIVFNGEIYNYKEIKEKLKSLGCELLRIRDAELRVGLHPQRDALPPRAGSLRPYSCLYPYTGI